MEAGQTGPCVLDQFTGLVWEVKTDTPGTRNRENTYSWFNPEEDASGELDYRGMPGGGKCSGSACDTFALVQEVNKTGYCGFNDWRMPARDELGSISDPRKSSKPPSINTVYFPAHPARGILVRQRLPVSLELGLAMEFRKRHGPRGMEVLAALRPAGARRARLPGTDRGLILHALCELIRYERPGQNIPASGHRAGITQRLPEAGPFRHRLR